MSQIVADTNTATRVFEIRNQYGIHARPAALFVRTTAKYDVDVTVEKDGNSVSGKSIMGLMTLEASRGSKLKVTAIGLDAERVLDDLQALFQSGFDEE